MIDPRVKTLVEFVGYDSGIFRIYLISRPIQKRFVPRLKSSIPCTTLTNIFAKCFADHRTSKLRNYSAMRMPNVTNGGAYANRTEWEHNVDDRKFIQFIRSYIISVNYYCMISCPKSAQKASHIQLLMKMLFLC